MTELTPEVKHSEIMSSETEKLPAPEVATLDDLIRELHRVFASDFVNVEYVHDLMSSYKSNPAEWKKFAKYDRYRYTRNLVDEGNGKFNLMILCWEVGHSSSIHDHTNAHCFLKVLDGSLAEVRFAWPESDDEEKSMVETQRAELKMNGVYYINDSMGLHRVENRSHTDRAASLHLYCPPFDTCHCFDQRTGHKAKCKISFWSKYGQKVRMREPASCLLPGRSQ